ncbi:resolvase [Ochrobactrum sp. MYb29]|nr:resolvase [Ochrobactrum sp. MYb29]
MKKIRCAVYTRKSSEEGLDQAFNSLHAQREACVSYVSSQKHEGWVLLPDHYDDGGVSGGTLQRPGLRKLLQDVDDGLVDQIVVYKIDRLTRSLADFAKLVDRLDAVDASFVSVTQSFNTATSMGRLTLNVLLSFAQFEREVTAERIRDKISASKKKGLWMGGPVPLGYVPDGRTLRIVEEDARIVRALYELYLQYGSLITVTDEAARIGLASRAVIRKPDAAAETTKLNELKEAQLLDDGKPANFSRSQIHYILSNPIYAGRIRHRDRVYDGQHPAIIEPAVWDDVQKRMATASVKGRGATNSARTSPLAGKLTDETGDRLTPSHANKRGVRYRYYVSNRLLVGKKKSNDVQTSGWRLPAHPLECQLADHVREHWKKNTVNLLREASADETQALVQRLNQIDAVGSETNMPEFLACIDKAQLLHGVINVVLDVKVAAEMLCLPEERIDENALRFSTPFQLRRRGVEAKLIVGHTPRSVDAALLANLARAHHCYGAIRQGQSFDELAAAQQLSKRRILQLISFAFLAPDIVKAIIQGEQPVGLTSEWLQRNAIPLDWQEQRRIIATL